MPGGVLHQKIKYFVMKVVRGSVNHWVSCQSIATNQSFLLLMQKLAGKLMIKCARYAHGLIHSISLCVKRRD